MSIESPNSRIVTDLATRGSLKDLPGQTDRIEQRFRSIAMMELAEAKKKQGAESSLAHHIDAQRRLSRAVADLPDDVSGQELRAWQGDLSETNAAIASFQSELLSYQSDSGTQRFRERSFDQLSRWLGVSATEVEQMHTDHADKLSWRAVAGLDQPGGGAAVKTAN